MPRLAHSRGGTRCYPKAGTRAHILRARSRGDSPRHSPIVSRLSDLRWFFRVGFADGYVRVLRRIYWFFDGRWGGLGGGAEIESSERVIVRLHGIQMLERVEWKPF